MGSAWEARVLPDGGFGMDGIYTNIDEVMSQEAWEQEWAFLSSMISDFEDNLQEIPARIRSRLRESIEVEAITYGSYLVNLGRFNKLDFNPVLPIVLKIRPFLVKWRLMVN